MPLKIKTEWEFDDQCSIADTVRVRVSARVVALLALFGWLFATGHVVLQHGAVVDGGAHHALFHEGHGDDHDHDAPSRDSEHHHHDLTAAAVRQWVKSVESKAAAPVWLPLYDVLADQLMADRVQAQGAGSLRFYERSPPDGRASGWLLVCRSALPVRGPCLAV
jgi:hypothetical protein